MRTVRHLTSVALLVAGLSGPASPSHATTGCAPATANANVTTNETWTLACSPYNVTANITVRDGATLTIQPGVQVRFGSARTLTVSTATLTGGLNAAGTAGSPIVFTSSLASPTPGAWSGIVINKNVLSGSVLSHALIRYAGVNPALKLDQVGATALTVANIEITDCNREGVSANLGAPVLDYITVNCPVATKHGFLSTSSNFTLRSSTLSNSMNAAANTTGEVTGNTFKNYPTGLPLNLYPDLVGRVLTNNVLENATTTSAVDIAAGNVLQTASWPQYSYRVTGAVNVRSPSAPMLTIAAGAQLRFSQGGRFTVSSGTAQPGGIIAVGTPTSPILFATSVVPAGAGKWNGVELIDAILPESRLEHVIIEHTGLSAGPGLRLSRVPDVVTLRNGIVRQCNGQGVLVNFGEPVLDGWTIDCSAGTQYGSKRPRFDVLPTRCGATY